MRYAGISFMILVLWALPVRYYYVCKIKQHCPIDLVPVEPQIQPPESQLINSLMLVDEDSAVIADFQQFYFQPGQALPEMTPDNEAFLDLVAAYLISNPNKQLTITANISNGSNTTKFIENLGNQRTSYIMIEVVERGVNKNRIRQKTEIVQDNVSSEPLTFSIDRLLRAQSMR